MTPIPLPAILDLPASVQLLDLLRAENGPVALDGADVERIGVLGLQLLLSARATADAAEHAFIVERSSAALQAAARTAGAGFLLASPR